jgi:hypothetical protein
VSNIISAQIYHKQIIKNKFTNTAFNIRQLLPKTAPKFSSTEVCFSKAAALILIKQNDDFRQGNKTQTISSVMCTMGHYVSA